MKAVGYFVFLSVAIVTGRPNRKILVIPEEFVPPVIKASADCADKFGLETIDILAKYFSGGLEDSDSVRKYMYCLGTTTGYIDGNANIVKGKIAKVVGEHKEKVGSVVDECNKSKFNDKYEKVFHVVQCFRENSGIMLKV
ncbi:unnamed protein product, partial [Brenthis ino]